MFGYVDKQFKAVKGERLPVLGFEFSVVTLQDKIYGKEGTFTDATIAPFRLLDGGQIPAVSGAGQRG